jgi:predicted O-methyltransferase YrrM
MINLSKIEEIKGFMPNHEGEALMSWAKTFSKIGPLLEIGSFCGKSSIYLGLAAKEKNQVVFTIDHHKGSEEHQLNEEYFDPEIYDESLNSVNTFPLFLKNIRIFDLEDSVIPIVSSSARVAKGWNKNLGMVFIDGSHSLESATLDYESWGSHIKNGGALVIHDIFEDPNLGGQAPYEIYKRALNDGYKLYERVDTIVCLTKDF